MRGVYTTISVLSMIALLAGCPPSEVEDCILTNGGIEACGDGRDNDCDGQIDAADSDCFVSCTPTNGGIEACSDAIDNDCDGFVDMADTDCQGGECSDGQTRGCGGSNDPAFCVETCSGRAWGQCRAVGAGVEICGDGIDNNCDRLIDEGCVCDPGDTRHCGANPDDSTLCVETCGADGQWGGTCAVNPPNPGIEICDEFDNDCDGERNEGAGCACIAGDEEWCGGSRERHNCRQTCEGGTWSGCVPVPGHAEEEICGDATDNDCDGVIDQPIPCTSDCGTGVQSCEGDRRGECVVPDVPCHVGDEPTEACPGEDRGVCDPGERTRSCDRDCNWGPWSSCVGVVGPSAEVCNGLDDNCNGTNDEGAMTSTSPDGGNNIDTCRSLGVDPSDMNLYPVIGDYGTDWYCFEARDSALNPLEDIVIRVTDMPSIDIDVFLHFEDPETGEITELASSERRGTMDEEIEFNDRVGTEDAGIWYIQIENMTMGAGGCYHLYVDGLN